jgi:hypothetical protein
MYVYPYPCRELSSGNTKANLRDWADLSASRSKREAVSGRQGGATAVADPPLFVVHKLVWHWWLAFTRFVASEGSARRVPDRAGSAKNKAPQA